MRFPVSTYNVISVLETERRAKALQYFNVYLINNIEAVGNQGLNQKGRLIIKLSL